MNSFGQLFKISLFGESHGEIIGVVIDGVKEGIPLATEDFLSDIARRKPNLEGTTKRLEEDCPRIVSGWYNGFTTGAPLTILFSNQNICSADYNFTADFWRPGHADFVAEKKFKGFNDPRGGGHFSGRLTLPLVAAGVVAKKMLPNVSISARLISVHNSENIEAEITEAIKRNDSVGGIVECTAKGLPVGVGEPFFNSVESVISHAVFSIPAIKGIEFGGGFKAAAMYGSEHNDRFLDSNGNTATNHSGGILGGITTGNDIVFRVAVKPTSSIELPQNTYNKKTERLEAFTVPGRHDVCIALRVPVVMEAVTAIALVDLWLAAQKK